MIGRAEWRTLGVLAVALLCLGAAFGLPHLGREGSGQVGRAHSRTPTPASTILATPPAPLGPVVGAGVRLPIAPRRPLPDLTVAGADAAAGRLRVRTANFVPTAEYAAGDTLASTGPGLPGPLSGLPTRPALAQRRPVAVVLDNYDPDGRPQAGLNRASLVFETPAEGGITRLMAVYLEGDAPIVGPVRSTRPPFDAWADGLGVVYGHAGGSADAQAELPRLASLVDADPLTAPGAAAAYWRSSDRRPLHDLYTSTEGLRALASGVRSIAPSIPRLPHRAPAGRRARPGGGSIGIAFSTASYRVGYRYDPGCNCYPRSMNGVPHLAAFSARQLAPTNVVVLFADVVPDPASGLPDSLSIQAVGAGRALYFRDGSAIEGQWRKVSSGAPLALLDVQGRPIAFDPGQIWIEVVPVGTPISWQTGP